MNNTYHLNSYHYGADTCEACKVFFYRSIKIHETYKCKNERKLCNPNSRYLFACKFCRYNRCIEVGMSRSAIKVGRYSKLRHEQNLRKRDNFERLKTIIPFLPRHTFSDDLLTQYTKTFNHITSLDWMPDYKPYCQSANSIIQQGTVSKEMYMDVLEVTGVELDGRKEFMEISSAFSKESFVQILPELRGLPGMLELTDEDFKLNILSHYDQFAWVYFPSGFYRLQGEDLCMKVENNELIMNKNVLVNFSDETAYQQEIDFIHRYQDIALTFEESVLILAFSLVRPDKKQPHFQSIYNRLVLTFTRYLERQYGKNYETRLGDIVSFLSFAAQARLEEIKWIKKNYDYVRHIYQNDILLKILCHGGTSEEIDKVSQWLNNFKI